MRRLVLMGPIGAGKSTLIRNSLGSRVSRAGGFVTRRISAGGQVLGFDLSSPRIWIDPYTPARRFLDLQKGTRDDLAFSQLGVPLLEDALCAPFAVADEFGGLELLVPEFREALYGLLSSEVPTVGVVKAPAAAHALAREISLGNAYFEAYSALVSMLEADPDTLLLPMEGWDDQNAIQTVRNWTEIHLGR